MKSEWFKQRNNGMDYAVADNNEFSQRDDGCGRWLRTLHGQEVKCQGTEPLQNQQRDIIKSLVLNVAK